MIGFKSLARKTTNLLLALALVSAQLFAPLSAIVPKATAAIPDVCVSDVQGANDEPGQKDLTRFCQADDDVAGEITISWQWDEIAWSGNNTGDACALFDTNSNNFSNYAVCVTVSGSPATQSGVSPRIYTCNDSALEKCAGSSLVSGPYVTTCSVSQTASDPFPGPPNKKKGAAFPNDTGALCVIKLSEVGAGAAVLKDVCSFPSQQPNSDPSDCVVTPTNNTAKYVEIVKDLNPAGSGTFSLRVDGIVKASGVGDGGSTGQVEVDGVDVDVSEVATGSTSLANFTTSIVCVDAADPSSSPIVSTNPTGETSRSAEFDFPGNVDEVLCTITNTQKTGNIQVVKDVINDNGGDKTYADFTFQVNGGPAQTFEATTSPDGARTVSVPMGSTYTITEPEANLNGYNTSYSGCTDINPVVGQTQVCTITNNDNPPSLTLNKIVSNAHGGSATESDWTLTATGPTTISGAGSAGSDDVVSGTTFSAGTYTLSESAGPAGYTASTWSCTNGVTVNGNNQITLVNGQTTVCTITNSETAPALTLMKNVINNSGGALEADDFVLRLNGTAQSSPILSNSNLTATYTAVNVTSNTLYTLTEDANSNYAGSAVSCIDNTTQLSVSHPVTLSEGQSVTCSITNDDISPTIQLIKSVINLDGGIDAADSWTLIAQETGEDPLISEMGEIPEGEDYAETDVYDAIAGVIYNLSESGPSGYTPSVWNCNGGTLVNGTITLGLAQNVICTITNNDNAPSLTVVKNVVNDDGGDNTVSSFGITMNSSNLTFGTGVVSGNTTTFTSTPTVLANTNYTLSESDVIGYTEGTWSCTDGTNGTGRDVTVNLALDEDVTCTITNNDVAPVLTLKKVVVSANTELSSADWTLTATPTTGTAISGDGDTGVDEETAVAHVTYTLSESGPEGTFDASDWECISTSRGDFSQPDGNDTLIMSEGANVTCTITNTERGSITIIKDAQPDSSQEFRFTGSLGDSEDEEAPNFTLTDDGEDDITDRRTFDDLTPGTYTVTEPNVTSWTLESITCEGGVDAAQDKENNRNAVINLAPGEDVTCTFVNTRDTGSIKVNKLLDDDGDEVFETTNPEIFTWSIDGTGTNAMGSTVSGVVTDQHSINENTVAGYHFVGWFPGNPTDNDFTCNDLPEGEASTPLPALIDVVKDQTTEITLCNARDTGTITVNKNVDMNADGDTDDEEDIVGTTDWTWDLGTTDFATGSTQEVVSGDYTIHEDQKVPDYEFVSVSCVNNREQTVVVDQAEEFEVTIANGDNLTCTFTNRKKPVALTLVKTNDRPAPTVVGDTVTYTLTVTVPDTSGTVYNATVTDIPPEGFEYIPGSETATTGSSLTKTYASPGQWSLGDLTPGSVVTLTYGSRILDTVSAGTYPDIAYAEGCDTEAIEGDCEVDVYSNVTNLNEDGTPFVGTRVTIRSPQVLGASTTVLVNTGAADIWRNLAVGTLLMGAALATLYRREQKGGRA